MTVYVTPNFKTKKALKEALRLCPGGVQMFLPGMGEIPENGKVFISGPHYPAPHTWYAEGKVENGVLVSVK